MSTLDPICAGKFGVIETEVTGLGRWADTLDKRIGQAEKAIDEGRSKVYPIETSLALMRDEFAVFRQDIKTDLSGIQKAVNSGVWQHTCQLTLSVVKYLLDTIAKMAVAFQPLISVLSIIARNEKNQLAWVALISVSIAAIIWGVPVALEWSGVTAKVGL